MGYISEDARVENSKLSNGIKINTPGAGAMQ